MSPEPKSEIQQKIYQFIVEYMKTEGMPPTNREIGKAMHIASTGHVDYHLSMLEKKGFISRQPKKSRGIKLVAQTEGVQIRGYIAAGSPIEAFSEAEQFLPVNQSPEYENAYALIVKGRSMIEDHICDGDYVVVRPQSNCENGDIVVALHMQPGTVGSATLKRFYQEKDQNRIRLQPANSEMDPIYVPKSEWDEEWQVQGKVIAIFRQCGGFPGRAA